MVVAELSQRLSTGSSSAQVQSLLKQLLAVILRADSRPPSLLWFTSEITQTASLLRHISRLLRAPQFQKSSLSFILTTKTAPSNSELKTYQLLSSSASLRTAQSSTLALGIQAALSHGLKDSQYPSLLSSARNTLSQSSDKESRQSSCSACLTIRTLTSKRSLQRLPRHSREISSL